MVSFLQSTESMRRKRDTLGPATYSEATSYDFSTSQADSDYSVPRNTPNTPPTPHSPHSSDTTVSSLTSAEVHPSPCGSLD